MPRSTEAAPAAVRRLRTAVKNPRRVARAVRARLGGARVQPVHRGDRLVIGHAEALAINGFTVYRGLVPPQECAQLGARLKQAAGIVEGERFTRTDATFKIPETQDVLFDERVLRAVRTSLGDVVRFLQVSDLHYLHDTTNWHRDSVHRAEDNSDAPDWRDDQGRFGIVKAILYLESENAAMGLLPGSHLSPKAVDIERVKVIERRGEHVVVDVDDEPNRLFSETERARPLAWRAQPGDLLVFDQRLYHSGRRVVDGAVTKERDAPKFTLSLVFGLDNMHSARFFSYFRYARRELGYKPLPSAYVSRLRENDLLLSHGLGNYYAQHPEEIRLAALRNPDEMDTLVEDFRRAGEQGAVPR